MTYQDYPLPYLYLIFKSYYQQYGRNAEKWRWPIPINGVEDLTFDDLLETIVCERPTIVAFSSYIWNYKLNLDLAKAVKLKIPQALIVFGGPETPFETDPEWLKTNWFIDIVSDSGGIGELFVSSLLDEMLEDQFNLNKVPYAVIPSGDRLSWVRSEASAQAVEFNWPSSMFRGNESEVELFKHVAESRGGRITTLWETTRGCPHRCSYCDWGGRTGSKILKKSDEIVFEELRQMERYSIEYIDICDANFGIYKQRDIGIVKYLIDRSKNGWDFEIGLNGKTKNDIETVHEIDRLTLESGIAVKSDYHYSINASDAKIAKAVNRWSHPTQLHLDFIKEVKDLGYRTRIEYVLGLPESTLESFYHEFDDIAFADAWLSERYVWTLLSKSPAADPKYIEKYKIKTVPVKYTHYNTFKQAAKKSYYLLDDEKYQGTFNIVVQTSSYTQDQWIQMYIMDNFVRGWECIGLTTGIRILLENLEIKPAAFYEAIWIWLESLMDTPGSKMKNLIFKIKCALEGTETFSFYDFNGEKLGLQTIGCLILVQQKNEFSGYLNTKFKNIAGLELEFEKLEKLISQLERAGSMSGAVIERHSKYIYGPDSKRVNFEKRSSFPEEKELS